MFETLTFVGIVCLSIVAFLVAVVGLAIPLTILRGWVLSKLWLWFIVPLGGFQPIGIAHAIGLSIIIAMLTHEDVDVKAPERTTTETVVRLIFRLGAPLIALGIGAIVHSYMQ